MSFFKDALTKRLPEVLWHGSAFRTGVLKPGYLWTKQLVQWDHGESNHYLYATSEEQLAISAAIGSAIEKSWRLDRFKTYGHHGNTILIETPDTVTHYDLEQLCVWLYEIHPQTDQQWVFNHTARNGRDGEYKTHRQVPWARCTQVDLKRWLGTKDVYIRKTK